MIQSNFSMQMLDLDTFTKTNRKNSKDEETHRRNEVLVMSINVTSENSAMFGKSFSTQQVSHTNSAIPTCQTNLFHTPSWSQLFEFSSCLEQLCSWLKFCSSELRMVGVAKIWVWIMRNHDSGSCYTDTSLFHGCIKLDSGTLFSSSGFRKRFFRCKTLKTALICTKK